MTYTCEICGQEHDDFPALAYNAPDSYYWLTEEKKVEYNAQLDSDFCSIEYPDQTDRFIRCVLVQKVNDYCQDLEYGFWVSLSEKSFNDYKENYDNENHETGYFGWLSSTIPQYKFDIDIPTDVITKRGNSRPEIIPHHGTDHPFVKDYYNGISKAEAEKRIHDMLSKL